MLRLLLDGNEMDLYEDVSVNLTLQFSDVQNVNSPAGSFSQTFRIPATANNLDYFGAIDDTTAVDIVNVKQRIPAQILSDTIPILSGFCQVKAVYLQKEKYADIELVFFGGAVDLKSSIGDGMISDLDLFAVLPFSSLEVNSTNIQNSWLATSTNPAPYVRFGVIDRGFNWRQGNRPWGGGTNPGLAQVKMTPFVSVYTILDAILTEAGYTWESSFFVDPAVSAVHTKNMYVPCLNSSQYVQVDGILNDDTIRVNLDGDIVTTTGATGTLPLKDNVVDAYDPEDNWDNTTYEYTCPRDAIYNFKIRLAATLGVNAAVLGPHQVSMRMYVNGVIHDYFDDSYLNTEGVTQEIDVVREFYEANLSAGDVVHFEYNINNYGTLYGGGAGDPRCFVELELTPPVSNFDVDLASSLPKMKQMDFLIGLQKMFNLVFVPDKNKPKHLIVEPFQDYIATGTQKDWTDKVDYSKDLTFKPTTDLQKKQYQWTYKPGLDFISDALQKSLDRVYGRYQITEPDNDFATGELKVETNFGQFMVSRIPFYGGILHRSLTAQGEAVEEPLPMVAYWVGLTNIFTRWYLAADIGVAPNYITLTEFPTFSNYNTVEPTVGDKDLNYGMEQPFIPIEANPANTLYFEYWAQYVAELYSNEARIMTCTMRLSKRELADFEFSDNIYLKDSYWRVLNINYDTNVEGTAKVELIKILSDVEICADIPTGYSERGRFVLFNGSTEVSPDIGSRACCEKYGYEWLRVQQVFNGVGYPYLCKPKPLAIPPEI